MNRLELALVISSIDSVAILNTLEGMDLQEILRSVSI